MGACCIFLPSVGLACFSTYLDVFALCGQCASFCPRWAGFLPSAGSVLVFLPSVGSVSFALGGQCASFLPLVGSVSFALSGQFVSFLPSVGSVLASFALGGQCVICPRWAVCHLPSVGSVLFTLNGKPGSLALGGQYYLPLVGVLLFTRGGYCFAFW